MTDEEDVEAEARRQRIEARFAGAPVTPPRLVPGGYPVELFDRPDGPALEEIGTFLHRGAVELMRRGRGSLSTTGYVFCRHDPMGSAVADPLYTASITSPAGHDEGAVKSALCLLLHGVAIIGSARAVAFVMESWLLPGVSERPSVRSLGDVPGRIDALTITFETASIRAVWTSPITRYGGRGFSVAPFGPAHVGDHGGRFYGLMTPGYNPDVAATPVVDRHLRA